MPDPHTLWLFSLAALALLVVPGPAVIYIVTRSIDQGRTAGLVSMLGIHAWSVVHVAAAALGLSAILMTSSIAYSVVKYAGAAYLIFLGLRTLLARTDSTLDVVTERRSLRRIFLRHGVRGPRGGRRPVGLPIAGLSGVCACGAAPVAWG
jgi:threonine/homoserine/homoserine lactone efflux protein